MQRYQADSDRSDLLYDLAYECETLFDECLAELKNKDADSVAELVAEYRYGFAAWAANLGVFARKSQSLDTRLENHPDVADIIARLLDILRRSLSQRAYLEPSCHMKGNIALRVPFADNPGNSTAAHEDRWRWRLKASYDCCERWRGQPD